MSAGSATSRFVKDDQNGDGRPIRLHRRQRSRTELADMSVAILAQGIFLLGCVCAMSLVDMVHAIRH